MGLGEKGGIDPKGISYSSLRTMTTQSSAPHFSQVCQAVERQPPTRLSEEHDPYFPESFLGGGDLEEEVTSEKQTLFREQGGILGYLLRLTEE